MGRLEREHRWLAAGHEDGVDRPTSRRVDDLEVAKFDAIVVAGGQAPMFTFEGDRDLHAKFVEFYEAGKIAAALCHGVAMLRYAKLSSGEYLASGKTVTGFANVEEDFADNAVWEMKLLARDKHVMPWRIEDELARRSAPTTSRPACGAAFAVRDGNLVTGQQNFSGEETARLVVDSLGR